MIGFVYMMGDYVKEENQYDNTSKSISDVHLPPIPIQIAIAGSEISSSELKNREKRLRRAAAKKGLFIKKRKWKKYYSQNDYESVDGYCVGTVETGLIIWGENEVGINAPTLEEAEEIVANY